MTDVMIVSARRTAIGTSFKGSLVRTSAFDLAHAVTVDAVNGLGLVDGEVDDVVFGEGLYGGGNIARHAAVTAGLTSAPGLALNRHCASSLAAISVGAADIAAGMSNTIIVGGAQSFSTAPQSRWRDPATGETIENWISPSHPDRPDAPNLDMSITVGWNAAVEAGVSREEMDQWALESHQKAIAATDEGLFAAEIVPLRIPGEGSDEVDFRVDEHPRRGVEMEKLASLKPLHPEIEGFSITAGNASGINDGAAALVLMSKSELERRSLEGLARVRGWASVGVDPARTGLAPLEAIPAALRRCGLSIADIDLFEINEAFASVPVAAAKLLEIDRLRINPVGSGCSLGHPVSASGARMVTSLVHALRRRGGGIGVAAMCAGGGIGMAVVVEVG